MPLASFQTSPILTQQVTTPMTSNAIFTVGGIWEMSSLRLCIVLLSMLLLSFEKNMLTSIYY